MNDQNNPDNNNQNEKKSFYQKNAWWILPAFGLLVLVLFFRNLEFKNPFFSNETKKEAAIIDAIKNSSDRTIDAINKNGDKIGEKVDKNTETNKAGFQKIADTLSVIKKECISCKEKPKPCPPKVKPKPKKKPYPPAIKEKETVTVVTKTEERSLKEDEVGKKDNKTSKKCCSGQSVLVGNEKKFWFYFYPTRKRADIFSSLEEAQADAKKRGLSTNPKLFYCSYDEESIPTHNEYYGGSKTIGFGHYYFYYEDVIYRYQDITSATNARDGMGLPKTHTIIKD